MSKKVLLIMNCYEREYLVAAMIKDKLKGMDSVECRIMYWNRGIYENDIYKYMPNIVMTFPLTILPLINLIARIKVICKSQVVSFVTEGYINPNTIDEERWGGYYGFPVELIDYWCVWGEAYKELLWKILCKKGRIKNKDKIRVFGYPMWEHTDLQKIKEKNLIEREIQDLTNIYSNTILILSGFAEANKEKKDVLDSIDAYNENAEEAKKEYQIEKLLKKIEKIKKYRDKYYALAIDLIEKYPDKLFLLKLHPKEIEGYRDNKAYDFGKFKQYENVRVLAEENAIGTYINKISALIHYGSTVAWEAYICHVPTIRININDEELSNAYGTYGPGEGFDFNEIEIISKYIGNLPEAKYVKEYDEYLLKWFNYDKTKPYTPSKDLAQFLYDNCECRECDIDILIPYSKNDIAFKIRVVLSGITDILSANFKAGLKKFQLVFKLIKFSAFKLRD